jgi:hypothetical protein
MMPITAPMSTATISRTRPTALMPWLRARTNVATRAIVIPAMPKALPDRAVSCRASPARARMNSSAATM